MAIDEKVVKSAIGRVKGAALQQTLQAQADAATDDNAKLNVVRLAHDIRSSQGWFGWYALAVGAILVGFLIWVLSGSSEPSPLTDVASGRPILMIIIVSTTVVYGGILLTSALNAEKSDDFNDRFQRAREIFLVFSGICATVVGFYFGAGTAASPEPDQSQGVAVEATLGEGGAIVATVKDGTPPYDVILAQGEETLHFLADQGDETLFTLAVDAALCPAEGSYQVTRKGGAAYPPVPVAFSKSELAAAGWTACAVASGADEAAEDGATGPAEAATEAADTPVDQ